VTLIVQYTGVPEVASIVGTDFVVAEKDRLYRCLDRVLEHKQDLFAHLQQRWKNLFDVSFDVLLYDLTSTYVEGEAELNPKKDLELWFSGAISGEADWTSGEGVNQKLTFPPATGGRLPTETPEPRRGKFEKMAVRIPEIEAVRSPLPVNLAQHLHVLTIQTSSPCIEFGLGDSESDMPRSQDRA
jgi:hypothetical protein